MSSGIFKIILRGEELAERGVSDFFFGYRHKNDNKVCLCDGRTSHVRFRGSAEISVAFSSGLFSFASLQNFIQYFIQYTRYTIFQKTTTSGSPYHCSDN